MYHSSINTLLNINRKIDIINPPTPNGKQSINDPSVNSRSKKITPIISGPATPEKILMSIKNLEKKL